MQPHRKGDLTEAAVITELKRREIPVSIPFGDNERYDMSIEAPSGRLLRVQTKTGATTDGVIQFRGYSQHTNSQGNEYKRYGNDVDYFLVYSHEHDRLFLISEPEVGMNMSLRIEQPEQEHDTINWADDFDFDERWPPAPDGPGATQTAQDPSVRKASEQLSDNDIPFTRLSDQECDLLAVDADGNRVRINTRLGSVQNGRVRFNSDIESLKIDLYCVYVHDLETIYFVPSDAFERSISLRVEEPKQADSSINWAAEYRFDEQWPP